MRPSRLLCPLPWYFPLLPALSLPALTAAGVPPVAAQEIPGDPVSCPECSIRIDILGQFGLEDEGYLVRHPSSAAVDARGRLWVVVVGELPQLFEPDGTFIETVGRAGQGPGEYRWPSLVEAVGDSVVIFESDGAATVLGPDLSVVRTFRMPIRPTAIVPLRWPEAVVAAAVDRGRGATGQPLHLLDLSGPIGDVTRSFGRDDATDTPASSARLRRILTAASAPAGGAPGVWSASLHDYDLGVWNEDGSSTFSTTVASAWAEDGDRVLGGGPEVPPAVSIRAIHEAEDGRLWVVGWVPAEDWRDVWQEALARAGLDELPDGEVPATALPQPYRRYDSVLEVIDVEAGRIVQRRRLDRGLDVVAVLEDGRILIGRETEAGIPWVQIARVELAGG